MTRLPVNQRGSVPAVFTDDFGDRHEVSAGAFHFADGYDGTKDVCLLFGCPCGCGALQAIHVKPYSGARATWQWDGNRQAPTCTPSILIHQLNDAGEKVGEHWHGFLTAGEFRSC
jgi:hypothetical protein